MKKIFSILLALSALTGFAAGVTSCIEQPELMETLDLGACLTPSSTSMTISTETGRDVTFTWTNSKGATDYVLEIFESATNDAQPEDVFEGTPVEELNVASAEGTSTSTTVRLTEGKYYYARVKAQELDADGNPLSEDSHWATFPYPIEPYLVMDNIPSFTVTERTSSSITVAWEIAEGDADGVNQIRLSPDPENPQAAYKAIPVTASDRSLTIENLPASTKFTVAAHYNSANRGTVYPWTMPSLDQATRVNTDEALLQALKDGAAQILVEYKEEPYRITTVSGETVTDAEIGVATNSKIAVYGEGTPAGDMPVIIGRFTLPNGLTSFHLEGLTMNGDGYAIDRAIQFGSGFASNVEDISMLNCDVTGYKSGVYYDNTSSGVTISNLSFSNIYVTDTQGEGGDGFDMRTNVTVTNFSVTESTFTSDFRVLFRMDKNTTIGSINVSNNTFNGICATCSAGSNKGVFYIQGTVTDFKVNNNLFMNIQGDGDYSRLFRSGHSAVLTETKGNYFYNNTGEQFWNNSVDVTETSAGTVLTSDPCVDSPRNILNVTNTAVLNAKAGDPRWFASYVPAPTPDLVPVEYGYSWTLNDTYTFYDVVDQSTVRGNLKFIIASTPINIIDEGMEFSGEGTTAYGGVPTDGAIAFLVNGPGSIYASALASASGSTNDHITVAVGDAEGLRADVVGSIHVGAENEKIVFDQLEPDTEYLIYLYACGPVVLSTLEWSDDVNTGSTAVSDPDVTPTAGEGTLSLSWDAVENASGYVISFGAKEPDAEYGEDEYIIETSSTSYNWADFPSGTYTVNVQAIAADPTKNENSQIIGKTVTVTAPASLPQLTSATLTQEDMEFLLTLTEGKEINGNAETGIASSIYYKGFLFTGRSGKVSKFNSNENYGAFFNTGGSSDFTTDNAGRTIRFAAAGPGKLTYVVCSNGSDNRTAGVAVNNIEDGALATTQPQPTSMPANWDAWTLEKDLSTVAAGDVIDLYSTKSVNYISVTWTPTGGIESDPEAIEEQKDIVGYLATTYPDASDAAKVDLASETPVTIDKVTYCGKSGKPMQWDGDRIKFQGASDYDEKTVEAGGEVIPEGGYISFKVTKPGTIKHYIRSGSGSDTGRTVRIILVMNDGADIVRLDNFNAPTGSYKEGLEMTTAITEDHLSMTTSTATVYIYSLVNGVNAYYLEYIPD